MAEQNLTVWQRLSKTLGPNSLLDQDYPTFKLIKKNYYELKVDKNTRPKNYKHNKLIT